MPSLGSATIAALNRSGRFPTSSFTPRHTTILSHVHQVLGRAFRETGQLIDRLGIYMDSNTVDYDPDDDGREDGAVENVSEVQKYDMILSRHRTIFPLIGHGGRDGPAIAPTAFVAPCASIIGAVKVNDDASIWYGAIIRGDQYGNPKDRKAPKGKQGYSVTIGAGSNIQDGAVISANDAPTLIESDVTIGHRAQIHSATVCSNALIGMGAVVMQSAVIESNSYVAAGAVVESGTVVKGGELWVGNPARKLRDLTEKGIERLTYQANEVSLMVQNCYYNWICYVKMIL
mmetsp:Transcript_4856/g.9614  ORF Transcript_4856/g.9614 Transcript_4856/m.9614 type:complete len:288 (-) Transcript_4856:707-1570(-)